MAKKVKVKGKLKLYFSLLLAFGIVLAIVNIPIYILNIISGVVISVFLVVYFAGIIVMWVFFRKFLIDEMVSFATEYGQIQKQILKELNLPHALLDQNGKIVWANIEFEKAAYYYCDIVKEKCEILLKHIYDSEKIQLMNRYSNFAA